MAALHNLVCVSTATTGTGPAELGAAVDGGITFEDAGVQDGAWVSYAFDDVATGEGREVGRGQYDETAGTLTRELLGSTTGSLLDLSGSAKVFITALAEDFDKPVVKSGGYLAPPNAVESAGFAGETLYGLPVRYGGIFCDAVSWYCYGGTTGGEVRIGLYSSDANGMPDALLEGSGALSCDADAEIEYEFAAPRFLKGLYYLALLVNSAADDVEADSVTAAGGVPLPTNNGNGTAWTKAQTFGALPSTFGIPDDDDWGPRILVRLA